MRPPRSIRIGAHRYKVTVLHRAAGRLTERGAAVDLDDLAITLNTTTAPSRTREHLLHEVVHAALYEAGVTYEAPTAPAEVGEELEERLVRRVTPILLEVLRRNPKLLEYLLDG